MTTQLTRTLRAGAIYAIALCMTPVVSAQQTTTNNNATLAKLFGAGAGVSAESEAVEIVDQTQMASTAQPPAVSPEAEQSPSADVLTAAYCSGNSCNQDYCGDSYCGGDCYPCPTGDCGCTMPNCCCPAGDCCGGCSDGCGCTACCTPCCPKSTCYVFGEYLYLRPSGDDLAHAQQQDGTGGAGTTPAGTIGTMDYDYQSAYRVGAGCSLDGCSSIGVRYTMVDASTTSAIDPPVIGGGAGAVGSLVHHPQAVLTGSAGPVTATGGVEYELGEVVFEDVLKQNCWGRLGYSVGAVYADIHQDFHQNGLFGPTFDISTRSDISFTGGGLKAGLNGERCLGKGLSVYGKLSAAAISGSFESRYDMRNEVGDNRLANAQWDENRVIGLIEYELGLSACVGRGGCRVSVGYLVQHWTNMVTHSEFIDAVQADNYTNVNDTLTFDGLTARVEGRF